MGGEFSRCTPSYRHERTRMIFVDEFLFFEPREFPPIYGSREIEQKSLDMMIHLRSEPWTLEETLLIAYSIILERESESYSKWLYLPQQPSKSSAISFRGLAKGPFPFFSDEFLFPSRYPLGIEYCHSYGEF